MLTHPFNNRITMHGRFTRVIYLALLTVFVSNFSFHPFGTSFRFSLAVGAFTFFLLLNDDINEMLGGAVTGAAILAFRAGGNALLLEMPVEKALQTHYPAAIFYFALGSGMWLTATHLREGKLLSFIVLGLLDVGANVVELVFRGELLGRALLPTLYLLGVVALVRATLVGLAYTAWQQHDRIIMQQQERKEFERMLLVTSDVSGELLYLENTLTGMEKIMLQSYQLYQRLKGDTKDEAEGSLAISRDIHDIKKDIERLTARLRQVLVRQQEGEAVELATLVDIAVRANMALSRQRSKEISFQTRVEGHTEITEYHSVLSIINNLMGNAIEAIEGDGEIRLYVHVKPDSLTVTVEDTGVGIKREDFGVIFSPGYTTKYDALTGQASTGLGLAQVNHIVKKMGGETQVTSTPGVGSRFTVNIPLRGGIVV